MTETNLSTATCPACGHPKLQTLETRPREIGGIAVVYRRKKCRSCGHRFQTAEMTIGLVRDVLEDDAA